jgi:hypothetical protein
MVDYSGAVMPDFIVTDPHGQKFRVTAPEGTTQDQALAHFKANRPQSPNADLVDNPDYSESTSGGPAQASGGGGIISATDVASGIGRGLVGDVVGLGRLIPGVRNWSQLNPGGAAYDYAEAPNPTWGRTIGNVIGAGAPAVIADVLSGGTLTPELGAALAPRLAAMGLGRFAAPAARVAANALPAAAISGIQPTAGAPDYSQNIEQAVAGGLTGGALGEVFRPNAAVRALAGKVRLPFGSYGPVGRAWESAARRVPGLSRLVSNARRLAHEDAQGQYRSAAMAPLERIGRKPQISTLRGHAGLREQSNEAFSHYAAIDQDLAKELNKPKAKQDPQIINRLRFQRTQAKAAVNNVQELMAAADPTTGEIFPSALAASKRSKGLAAAARQLQEAGVPGSAVDLQGMGFGRPGYIPWWIRRHPYAGVGAAIGAPAWLGEAAELFAHTGGHPAALAGLGALASPAALYNSAAMRAMGQLARRPEMLAYLARLLAAQQGQGLGQASEDVPAEDQSDGDGQGPVRPAGQVPAAAGQDDGSDDQ